jgi:uncharacterized protein
MLARIELHLARPMQTSSMPRAWMRLPSGRRLDLIDPDPLAWTDEDLAVRLSRTYRWGGESIWPLPLSVAQHSLTVLALSRQPGSAPMSGPAEPVVRDTRSAAHGLRELLHDAEEAFLGFDCISPLKRALGQPFEDVSERLMAAVRTRYALPHWSPDEYAVHKRADVAAAAAEAVHCVGWSLAEVRDVLQIDAPILEVDPLAGLYGSRPWEPWPAAIAAERFIGELRRMARTSQV